MQTADIDMEGLIWTGIGKKSGDSGKGNESFKGIYDGGNHTITNLLLSSSKVEYVGLFSSINGNCGDAPDYGYTGAAVKNLTICVDPNTRIKSGGAVAGFVAGALIANVTVKGTLNTDTVNDSSIGGLIGRIYVNVLVTNCVNWATINNGTKRTGGFAGHASNSGNKYIANGGPGPNNGAGIQFVDCVNNGTLNAPGNQVAGFVGDHSGGDYNCIFIRCTNNGTIGQGSNGYQFIKCGANTRWAYTGNKCKPDQLACSSTIDGLNFGVVNDDVVTLITNAEVVVGGTYKVMSPIATLPITLNAVDQTIAFDVALNAAFAPDFTLTGVGLSAVTNDTLITYTAIKAAGEDWPDVPADVEGTDAKTTFPNLPADFEGADAGLVAAWAKNTGLAYADMVNANIDAFLLDCAPAEVATEAAKFKIISIENIGGEWVVKVTGEKTEGQNYTVNAKVYIVPYVITGASDGAGFFKATLVPYVITK